MDGELPLALFGNLEVRRAGVTTPVGLSVGQVTIHPDQQRVHGWGSPRLVGHFVSPVSWTACPE